MQCNTLSTLALVLALQAVTSTQSTEDEYQAFAPSNPVNNQTYGSVQAIDGDTLVVGSLPGISAGSVYVYTRIGSLWGSEKIVPGPLDSSAFGLSLDLDDGTLIVGDPNNANANGQDAGAAYVYAQNGTDWALIQKLVASNGTQSARFGYSAAVAGTTVVVGAISGNGVSPFSGSAYIFDFDGVSWREVALLEPQFGEFGASLGASVAIDRTATWVVVGAPSEDSDTTPNVGAAYVYRRTSSGWIQEGHLFDPAAASSEGFGTCVSIDAGTLLIGARSSDDIASNAGAAWIYERLGTAWTPTDKLYASDGFQSHHFGSWCQLSGDTALVSGFSLDRDKPNKIYQFQRGSTSWVETAQLLNSDTAPFDSYGKCFDFEGGNVVASGAHGAFVGPIRSGKAYIHVLDVPTITYCTGKTNSGGCVPAISDTGTPTWTGADDYVVRASSVLPSKPGLFFYGLQGPLAAPFFNATLCVAPPLARTPVQLSSAGGPCAGEYSFFVSQSFMAGADLVPGTTAHGQYWMRDPNHADGTGVGLSDAIGFSIQQ